MDGSRLNYYRENNIGVITLTSPNGMNVVSTPLLNDFRLVLDSIENDPEVKAVIIIGNEKGFCPGADLKEFNQFTSSIETYHFIKEVQKQWGRLEKLEKAVIAAVNGLALGGGFELALACDFILAAEDAVLGVPEINVGMLPGAGGMTRLTQRVGVSKAKELVFTGRTISANEALDLGLVNEIVPKKELIERAQHWALLIKEKPSFHIKVAKQVIDASFTMDLDTALEYEARSVALIFNTEDRSEGLKAFAEKRKAKFKGC